MLKGVNLIQLVQNGV